MIALPRWSSDELCKGLAEGRRRRRYEVITQSRRLLRTALRIENDSLGEQIKVSGWTLGVKAAEGSLLPDDNGLHGERPMALVDGDGKLFPQLIR